MKDINDIEELEMQEFLDHQADEKAYLRSKGSNSSLKSKHKSIRHVRLEEYKRYHSTAKTRSNVSGDKLQWDGHRSTYSPFSRDLEGTMLRLGVGYMFSKHVMEQYERDGMEFIKSDPFWEEHRISVQQFKYDTMYLYGLLQSATKNRVNPFLVHHRNDKDGLSVWIKFEQTYAYGGSKTMKSEELEEKIFLRYNPREHKGVADYIDKFQTWMEELEALGT